MKTLPTTTDTTTTTEHVPHLRDFLTDGGQFASMQEAGCLLETMCDMAGGMPPAMLTFRIGLHRDNAATEPYELRFDNGDCNPDALVWAESDWQRSNAWSADYMEAFPDPALDELVIAAMPRRLREIAPEEIDKRRRCHPITVGEHEHNWSCDNCGEAHDGGDGSVRLSVGWREGYSELEAPIDFCRACIASALAQFPA